MRKIGKALMTAALISFVCGIFGCGKVPEYTSGDIQSVSVSCGHMDYSYSYSFYLRKIEGEWLLDAEYAVDTENPRVAYENCPVAEKDVEELLETVSNPDLIKKLRRYKKPRMKLRISDETTYYTSILFADNTQLSAAALISGDMEYRFRRLAEKYAGTMPETNNVQTNSEEE